VEYLETKQKEGAQSHLGTQEECIHNKTCTSCIPV
jgi:hypothetical protein